MPASDSPASHGIAVKQRTFAFDLQGRSNITVRGLEIFAATIRTGPTSTGVVLDGLRVAYLSHFVAFSDDPYITHHDTTGIQLAGSGNVLRNSTLVMSAGNLVVTSSVGTIGSPGNVVTNNLLSFADYSATFCSAVAIEGPNQSVTHSTIHHSGRDVVHIWSGFGNQNTTIAYNNVYGAGILNQDLGDIYGCCGSDFSGSSIDHNWVHDTIPKNDRGYTGAASSQGIYLDNGSGNALVHHNVVWNTAYAGLGYNGNGFAPTYPEATGHRFFNNTVGPGNTYSAFSAADTNVDAGSILFFNNIFSQPAVATGTYVDDAGAYVNLPYTTGPLFVNTNPDAGPLDFHLQPGSPAINAGIVLPGITDGYVGPAPDFGAYESGGTDWTPGCSMQGC
jgi:hypothetical protein